MPFQGQALSQEQVESIRLWIEQGAPWVQQEKWWSLLPLHRPAVPAIEDKWIRTPIDAFVLAKLREKGLRPSPEADRRTLIRRLTYDLHGLPPSAEEVEAFVVDRSPDAYEKLVDRLLASPRYGERWGRHWLDVAHYGESHGYDKDKPRRNAWPYRDYVIRAFNEDKPYAAIRARSNSPATFCFPTIPTATVALGFIAAGPWDFVGHAELREGTTDKNITRLLDRDDMVTVDHVLAGQHDRALRALPRSQVRSDPPGGLLQRCKPSSRASIAPTVRSIAIPQSSTRATNLLAKKRSLAALLRPFEQQEAETTTPEIEALDKQVAD